MPRRGLAFCELRIHHVLNAAVRAFKNQLHEFLLVDLGQGLADIVGRLSGEAKNSYIPANSDAPHGLTGLVCNWGDHVRHTNLRPKLA
jgi:hypothetical protein